MRLPEELNKMGMYDQEEFMNYNEYDGAKSYHYSELVHETAKAYLFTINFNNYWVPKSICKNLNTRLNEFDVPCRYKLVPA